MNVSLAWNPSPSTNVAGYKVYYGPASGDYTNVVDAGNSTNITLTNLPSTGAVYFAALAYDANGDDSPFSNEAVDNSNSVAPPAITAQPGSITMSAGQSINLTVSATGTGTLTYQWYDNGTVIVGATNAVLGLYYLTSANAGSYDVVVSDSGGGVTSSVATLTVLGPPVITTQPASQTVVAGTTAVLSVAVSGTAPLVYQWYLGSSALAGATNATLTVPNVSAANAGAYYVYVQNSYGAVSSSNAVLTVTSAPAVAPPVISTQPAGGNVTAGQSVNLQVVVSGTGPMTYQWYDNGTAIAGATNSILGLYYVTSANAGSYDVVVSNPGGSVTSQVATVTVIVPPAITAQPASQTVASNATAVFSVSASGTAPFVWQWYFNGMALAGATNATLSITNASAANAGTYYVYVQNSAGSVSSSNAVLTLTNAVTPPVIRTQPASQAVAVGSSISLMVSVKGTAPIIYQWYENGTAMSGQTNATLTFYNVGNSNAGSYYAVVANSAGSVTSSVAVLTVMNPVVITTQPASQTVASNANATFSVSATGTGPFAYQWYFGAMLLAFGTNATLTVSNVSGANAGIYYVSVANAASVAWSVNATLTVTNAVAPPVIRSQPASQAVAVGSSMSLMVTATGTAPVTYQWYENGTAMSGQTNSMLTFYNVSTANAGSYYAVVANSGGSVTSSVAVLTVVNPVVIVTQPASQSVLPGGTATFSVGVTGTGPFYYQWYDGATALATATNATLTVANASAANAGIYYVSVGNAAGNAWSGNAVLTVTNPFVSVAGTYNGLFYQTNGNEPAVTASTAGMIENCIVGTNGIYSASILIGGGNYPLTGTLNVSGFDTEVVSRASKGLSNLTVSLQLDLSGATGQISGSVSNMSATNAWTAPLLADLATNVQPLTGKTLSLVLPVVSGALNSPTTQSTLTALVGANDVVTMVGVLADGAIVSEVMPIAKDGTFPFYGSLYGGAGVIEGWVNLAGATPVGTVTWFRPAGIVTTPAFPLGFTNVISVQ